MPAQPLRWLGRLALLLALAVVITSASRQVDAEAPQAPPPAAKTEAKDPGVDPASYKHHTYTPPGYKGPYKHSPDYYEKHHDGEHPYYEPEGPWYKDAPDYHEKPYDENHDGYAPKRPYYEDHYYPKPHYPKHKVYQKPPVPPPVCPFCPNNLTQCTSLVGTPQCLDLKSNILNCGECNRVCPKYSTCINGNCTCVPGFTKCGDKCVDLTSDNNYCGNCTTACNATSTDQFCSNSTCVDVPPPCGPGETQCFPSPNSQGTCVNLKNDSNACGACNRRCQLQGLVSCVDGDCCIPPGDTCLLPGVGLLCCGFNILSLIPQQGFVPTATCEASGLLGGRCCYGVNKGCSSNSECCTDLECKDLGPLGKTCQPRGCSGPLGPCNSGVSCCFGLTCNRFGVCFI